MPVVRSALYLLPHGHRVLQLTDKDRRRFNRKLKPVGDKGCLVWQGKPNQNGHGMFWLPRYKVSVLAHRAAWIFAGKEITSDMPFVVNVCPCGEFACCTAEHLKAGRDSYRDALAEAAWTRRRLTVIPELQPPKEPRRVVVSEVKLLGLSRRPTTAEVVGRKQRPRYKRTCREMYEARRAVWLAKKHQQEMDKLQRRREREAREERAKVRRERREVLGY